MLKRSPRRSDDGKTCVSESNGPLDEVLVGGDTRTPRTKSLALSLRGCPPSATNSAMAFGQQWGSKLPTRALHPGLGKKFYHLLTKQESHKGQWNSQGGTFKILYLYPSPSPTFIWFDLIWFDFIWERLPKSITVWASSPCAPLSAPAVACQVLSINGAISVQINTAKQSLQQEAGYAAGIECFGVLKRQ